jgi:endoglucanase
MIEDVRATIKLLVALVATEHDGLGERSIEERVSLRMKEYKKHLDVGNAKFEPLAV